jgi:hypothetical protein
MIFARQAPLEDPSQLVCPLQVLLADRGVLAYHSAQNLHVCFLDPDAQQPVVQHDAPHTLGDADLLQVLDRVAGRAEHQCLFDPDAGRGVAALRV